ncbi:MAG: hypothetical protein MHM6MM_007589 [Cercozoa sp. M6MM]
MEPPKTWLGREVQCRWEPEEDKRHSDQLALNLFRVRMTRDMSDNSLGGNTGMSSSSVRGDDLGNTTCRRRSTNDAGWSTSRPTPLRGEHSFVVSPGTNNKGENNTGENDNDDDGGSEGIPDSAWQFRRLPWAVRFRVHRGILAETIKKAFDKVGHVLSFFAAQGTSHSGRNGRAVFESLSVANRAVQTLHGCEHLESVPLMKKMYVILEPGPEYTRDTPFDWERLTVHYARGESLTAYGESLSTEQWNGTWGDVRPDSLRENDLEQLDSLSREGEEEEYDEHCEGQCELEGEGEEPEGACEDSEAKRVLRTVRAIATPKRRRAVFVHLCRNSKDKDETNPLYASSSRRWHGTVSLVCDAMFHLIRRHQRRRASLEPSLSPGENDELDLSIFDVAVDLVELEHEISRALRLRGKLPFHERIRQDARDARIRDYHMVNFAYELGLLEGERDVRFCAGRMLTMFCVDTSVRAVDESAAQWHEHLHATPDAAASEYARAQRLSDLRRRSGRRRQYRRSRSRLK